MNCHDVEPYLDQLTRSSNVIESPLHVKIREHLASCSACQGSLRLLNQWDAKLGQSMRDVVVPDGLSQRLVSAFHQTSALETESKPLVGKRNGWQKRSLVLAFVAVMGLCGVMAWTIRDFLRQTMLSNADVATLLQQSSHELLPAQASRVPFPSHWSSLRGEIALGHCKQLETNGSGFAPVMTPFELRPGRGQSFEGALLVIPKSRWSPAPVASVGMASMHYSLPYVWIVWSEGEMVFVVALDGPPPVLEHLQRQLDRSHSVL